MGLFGGAPKAVEPVREETEEFRDPAPLAEPQSTTVISEGVVISGKLEGKGTVQVEGVVDGEIALEGTVVVAPQGTVKGPVTASAVRAAGLLQGDITAFEYMRLEKTGIVSGDITTVSFVIEEGGWLNGRTTMERPKEGAASR